MPVFTVTNTLDRHARPYAAPLPGHQPGPREPASSGLSPAEIRQIILDLLG